MDFAATRLVVLKNGAPVFQQSYASVLEDVAEMLMLDFGISKLGAIELIQQEGLGVCNKCSNAQTRKQTIAMLENSAAEVIRNLRMVISTMRMDIDLIVLTDALATLPKIQQFCKQRGLTAPMENVSNLFTGDVRSPVASAAAAQKGYSTVSFITLNGVLTMPLGEANLLTGETNVLTAMSKDGSNKMGNIIAGSLAFLVVIWIAGILGWWAALEIQKNNDENTLKDERFHYAEDLIAREKKYKELTENMTANLAILPTTKFKMSTIVDHIYKEIVEKTLQTSSISVRKEVDPEKVVPGTVTDENIEIVSIQLQCDVKNYDAFTTLRDKIVEAGFFDVNEELTLSKKESFETDNATFIYSLDMGVVVSEKGFEQAKLTEKEQEELGAKLEGKTNSESSAEGKDLSDSEETSKDSQASSSSSDEASGS